MDLYDGRIGTVCVVSGSGCQIAPRARQARCHSCGPIFPVINTVVIRAAPVNACAAA